jgi:hypothetical protein
MELLNRLCSFDNRFKDNTIHFVLFQQMEAFKAANLKSQITFGAYALTSDKGGINNSSRSLTKYSVKEFEEVKKALKKLKIPYKLIN